MVKMVSSMIRSYGSFSFEKSPNPEWEGGALWLIYVDVQIRASNGTDIGRVIFGRIEDEIGE